MTKQELLDALAARFHSRGTERLQSSDLDASPTIRSYSVPVYELNGTDVLLQRNVDFIVQDEGLASNEKAFWRSLEPQPQSVQNKFRLDVDAYIAAKIADGTILGAFIVDFDGRSEKATAVAYRDNAGTVEERKFLLDYNVSSEIQHRLVGSLI